VPSRPFVSSRARVPILTLLCLVFLPFTLLGAGFDIHVALNAAARKLFPPTMPGERYVLKRVAELELYTEGFRYENYQVSSSGREVGCFTRLLVERDPSLVIDVAMMVRDGRVERVVALRPIKRDTSEFKNPDVLTKPLMALPGERYGGAMSRLFTGLSHIARVSQGKLPAPREKRLAQKVVNTMQVTQPTPVLGSPCPEIRGLGIDGRRISRANYRGRPFLVFVGNVDDVLCLELETEVARYLAGVGDTVAGLLIFENSARALLDRVKRGQGYCALTIADVAGKNREKLKAPYLPYLFGYDAKHKLVMVTAFKGVGPTRAALAEFDERVRAASGSGK